MRNSKKECIISPHNYVCIHNLGSRTAAEVFLFFRFYFSTTLDTDTYSSGKRGLECRLSSTIMFRRNGGK